MKTLPTLRLGLLLAALAGLSAATRAEDDHPAPTTAQVKFSDATKPGTLKAILPWADVHVIGTDAAEITVTSSLSEKGKVEPRADGLRRLDDDLAFELTEKDNVATLQLAGDSALTGQGAEFTIQLPRHTSLVLHTEMGGDIVVENIDGDIDVNSMNGEVTLRDIGSSAVVNTMNGEINATYKTAPTKPVSLSSMNGEVSLWLPADTRANLRMRSQNGTLLTDFPAAVLKTKTEHLTGATTKDKAELEHKAAEIAKRESEKAAREIEKAQREMDKAQAEIEKAGAGVAMSVPRLPRIPPIPPLPMFGGKSITGTLNGGGTDISLSTMNGSITVRQTGGTPPTASAGDPAPVTVNFQNPEKFTDVMENGREGNSERLLAELHEYVVKTAAALLPAGERLIVTFTDIDLAGDCRIPFPNHASNPELVRVMIDAYPPRLELKFQRLGADGKVLAEGERHLADMFYLSHAWGPDQNKSLYFEKALLQDWLRKELKPKA
ncbi:MAG: DUF3016 domain-containing protein [Opitutales bacterium]